VEVFLACATLGEAGLVSTDYLKDGQTISALRSQELQCSAQALGLKQVFLLGYRDSGMPGSSDNFHPQALIAQPLQAVVDKIAAVIREVQPEVVLTFDPIGGYHHPDHIRIHEATVQAFELARSTPSGAVTVPSGLYFHIMPRRLVRTSIFFLRLSGKDPHKSGEQGDIDLVEIARHSFPTHVKINYQEVAEKQARAAACHASQGGGEKPKGLAKLFMRLYDQPVDLYMQSWPPPSARQKVKRDFFEELDG
ncbi:MAG: PIG-L family deacetylase, partial [Anaerolineaceae bacterium]